MLVLALDTTTRQGSLAVARDGTVLATYEGDASVTHGERLPGDLLRLLSAHALRLADVDLFAVAAGPGSFTGLRIGIATMQGLALANARPLVGVSALDAFNETARAVLGLSGAGLPQEQIADEIAVWMDAQRGQVFSAVYKGAAEVEGATVGKPAAILTRWERDGRQPMFFAGDGAQTYRDPIRHALPAARIVEPIGPLAPALARLAAVQVQAHGASGPEAIRPIYIRRSDAELARDRRAEATTPARS